MKHLMETLKSARWVEWLLLGAFISIMLLMMSGDGTDQPLTQEQRLAQLLANVDGAGEVQVMLGGENGCVVLAEGGDDIAVALALQRAVKTLTGLPVDRIEIAKSR